MKNLFLLIVTFLFTIPAFSQKLGRPFLQNYPPKVYKAQSQNWSVIQDERGVMYFANTSCVLEYDGEFWREIELPNQAVGRALAKSKNGVVYVGSQASFGYLAPDSLGKMQYVPLEGNLPKEHQKFNDVWKVHVTDEGIYFMTDYKLYRMKPSGEFDRLWVPKGKSFFLSYLVDDELYVYESGLGPMKLIDNEFQLLEGAKNLAQTPIYGIVPFANRKLLLVTNDNGLYEYDPELMGSDAIYPFETSFDDELKKHILYSAYKMRDDCYALGTLRNGVYIMDAKGQQVMNINQQQGLQNNQVWNLGGDKQGGLWVCMNKGISRIEMNTPFTYWSAQEGVGKIFAITRFQNRIYIATGQSVFAFDEATNSFKELEGINNQCWTFFKLKVGHEERLLIGAQGGVYEVEGNSAQKIANTQGGFQLFSPSKFPNHLFYATAEGVGVIKNNNGKLAFIGKLEGFQEEVRSIGEDKSGDVYLGSYYRGVCRVSFPNDDPLAAKFTVYDTLDGLPSMKENYAKMLGNELVFTTVNGFYYFDLGENKFKPYTKLGKSLAGTNVKGLRVLGRDEDGRVWYHTATALGNVNPKTTLTDTTLFERLPEMEVNAFYADEQDRNIVWLGGSEGLFRYDKALTQIIPSYNVILRKVSFSSDSLVFGGTFLNRPDGVETKGVVSVLQPVNEVATFPYKLASGVLAFKFAAPSYDQEEKNRYQFKLDELNTLFGEGEEQWSNWTEKSEKEYTNLREGDYVFRVKAKNIYGIESEEMSYAFQILPPWYRSWWAYLAYVALASVVIWLIVRLNTVRLQRANDRLEKIVDERTAEVKKQNGQLQQQKEEILTQNEELQQQKEEIVAQRDYIEEQNKSLKEKNERIVDSIRYAQTIQEGILPFSERLNKYLKDYFILYRPKDIVSGDFYWFEEKEGTTFFAVADCTGHGVPGAFMSMIGTAILNDIVLKSNLLAPAEILEEMNRLIIRVLKQEYVASNQDGIDLGFVAWKTLDDQVHLSFSGAHRPLYYITDGKLEEVKGANKSIGGYQVEGRTFIDTEITLKAGDSIFMTTDGYADQNSEDRKKVGSLKLKEMIEANANKSIGEISELLNGYLNEHQGNAEQRDDITIVGIRF